MAASTLAPICTAASPATNPARTTTAAAATRASIAATVGAIAVVTATATAFVVATYSALSAGCASEVAERRSASMQAQAVLSSSRPSGVTFHQSPELRVDNNIIIH